MVTHAGKQHTVCRCTHARGGNTNLDLKGRGFIPIAGIVELVNGTLVYGIPLLKRRQRREDEWKNLKKEKQREAGKSAGKERQKSKSAKGQKAQD